MIVVGGENLIDFLDTNAPEGLPSYVAHPGGSPFNVAMAVGRQGLPVTYLTPISNDRLGDLLADRLESSGVFLGAPRSEKPTSLAVVSLRDGIPSYGFYRDGTAERQIEAAMLDNWCPKAIRIFHVGSAGLTGGDDAAAWEVFFNGCKAKGVLTSLDPNVRPSLIDNTAEYRARIKRMMQMTDLLKLSDEDVCWLYATDDFATARAACLADSKAVLTVFTRGAQGSEWVIGDRQHAIQAAAVPTLIDTVGAGDTFMGTMLVWLARNGFDSHSKLEALNAAELDACLTMASKAAAINCGKPGCQPPTTNELASHLQSER